MLREIPSTLFREWQLYEELEPFADERADFNAAHICQWLWTLRGDPKKYPDGRPLSDFLLRFGDQPDTRVKQTLEQQEFLIDAWVAGQNAIVAAGEVKQ